MYMCIKTYSCTFNVLVYLNLLSFLLFFNTTVISTVKVELKVNKFIIFYI